MQKNMIVSSNINEVIRAVLNFFFYKKISHSPKSTKTQPSKSTKMQICEQK